MKLDMDCKLNVIIKEICMRVSSYELIHLFQSFENLIHEI